jgi:acetyl esterase/lipase
MASNKEEFFQSHEALPPLLTSKLSITTQASYFLQLWGLKIATSLSFAVIRLIRPSPPEIRPTLVKTYACRPRIRNRIFIPKAHKTGELLPLILAAHPGGFALLDAEFDDEFCSTFANKFNVVIVSIDYNKAPSSKFPGPTNEIVAIAQAVIEDGSLPVDKSRVVLNGFSAGDNLCLSAAQMPELKDKLKGIVTWYPVADFTLTPEEKQNSRPYRNAKDIDDLKDWGPIWDWGYIRPGQDIRDPLLSVRYARKENLPSWIYNKIGAEYDFAMKQDKLSLILLIWSSWKEMMENMASRKTHISGRW